MSLTSTDNRYIYVNSSKALRKSNILRALDYFGRDQVSRNKTILHTATFGCFNKITMAEYRITGVWVNQNRIITHYAFHTVGELSTSRTTKITKADAIALLEKPDNTAVTWIWNYKSAAWNVGETVTVVNGENGKYLRSNPDNTLTDNLEHLIDLDWIAPRVL